MAIKDLPIADLVIDCGTQHRPIDEDVVSRYKALIEDKVEFPPVDVIQDGKSYYLFDGFHRYHAYRKLGKKYIPCSIEVGTKREAVYYSFQANKNHGFPRQPGTAKEIVLKMLADDEWSKMSQSEIALWVGTTRQFVNKTATELKAPKSCQPVDKAPPKTESETKKTEGNVKMGKTKTDKPMVDVVGEVIPEKLVPVFQRRDEIRNLILQLNNMLKAAKDAQANNDPLWKYNKLNPLETDINNVKRNLRFTLPYAVCRYCMGKEKGCNACHGMGFVNEQSYYAVPKEMKK